MSPLLASIEYAVIDFPVNADMTIPGRLTEIVQNTPAMLVSQLFLCPRFRMRLQSYLEPGEFMPLRLHCDRISVLDICIPFSLFRVMEQLWVAVANSLETLIFRYRMFTP